MGCGLLCFAEVGDREEQEADSVAQLCWEVGESQACRGHDILDSGQLCP